MHSEHNTSALTFFLHNTIVIHIFSISLGCPKNRVDTEQTLGSIGPVLFVSSPEEADLIFLNTCGFIQSAITESVRTILEQITLCQSLPKGKRPLLAVAGCLVGRFGPESLAPDLPEVDLLLPSQERANWAQMLCKALGIAESQPGRLVSTGPSYAWLRISDGCRHKCSFCTIPSIRGPLVSFPAEELASEAADLLQTGVKELILVAQDLTAYGKDTGSSLLALLEKLLPLQGLFWLRLMYLYPAGLSKELLQFLQQTGAPFIPYFDIPVQHAAPEVLKRMGRPFATDPYASLERVREFFPQAALRTSIITGFPGETEKDFMALCDFIEAARFMHLGVFTYEAEEGTPAATMPNQIPDEEKQQRKDIIMNIQSAISEELLQEFEGTRQHVLVDAVHDEWPGLHKGRTWFQAPDIDGITYVSGSGVQPGAIVEADITEAGVYDLTALADPEE